MKSQIVKFRPATSAGQWRMPKSLKGGRIAQFSDGSAYGSSDGKTMQRIAFVTESGEMVLVKKPNKAERKALKRAARKGKR